MNEYFRKFSRRIAEVVGSPWAFMVALLVILTWLVSGPLFHFSDTWQLIINTGTTIVTFLMVFVIQASQNRDSKALHLKIDELIRAMQDARTAMVDLEDRPEEELKELADEFRQLGKDEVAAGHTSADEQIVVPANGAVK